MLSLFKIRPKKYSKSALFLQAAFIFFAFIIVLQLINLQIIDPKGLKNKAKLMRQPARTFSFRGEIVDRNGLRLAADTTLYDIYAHPQYYKKETAAGKKISFEQAVKEMATELSPHLKKPYGELYQKLNNPDLSTITLAKSIERDVVAKIKKLKIRGLDMVKKNERVYPQGNLASHILGYVNLDANLSAGVERTGSRNLETVPKIQPIEYDGRGDVIYDYHTDPSFAAIPLKGQKLTLTIDSSVQHVAEVELAKMMQKTKAERGTVIVMNPKNGELLGFAVLPSYNPNKYNKVNPSIVKNWVLSDVYPPGSTFKIITVASGLETGSITKYEKILDTGKISIQGWPIENYDYKKRGAPGLIDLKYLFVHSSNIGSLKVSLKIPKEKHYNILRLFGIGSKTGIDLPGESKGIIHNPDIWDTVTQATIGFGYGIAATPIQMVSAVASIANNGIWVTPHVIKYDKETYAKRIKTRRVLSAQTASDMIDLLSSSIQASESKAGKIKNYTVAGKTGTSRKPNPNGPGYLPGQVFTSFVGFFPAKNPKVLIMVVVDNPKGVEIWGSTVAGPVFNTVATEVARILNIPPDAPGLNAKIKEVG